MCLKNLTESIFKAHFSSIKDEKRSSNSEQKTSSGKEKCAGVAGGNHCAVGRNRDSIFIFS